MRGRHAAQRRVVCLCLPLRSAVFFCALGTALLSLVLLALRGRADEALRACTGGYALQSRVIVDLLEVSGLVWGALGALGVLLLRSSYVRVFFYYQVVRLLAWLMMYLTDVPLLWSCELWRADLKEAATRYGWNDVMHEIAMNSHCQHERTTFLACSTLTLLCSIYFTMATKWLLLDFEQEPRYLLHLSKDHPSSAFYTHSRVCQDSRQEPHTSGSAWPALKGNSP